MRRRCSATDRTATSAANQSFIYRQLYPQCHPCVPATLSHMLFVTTSQRAPTSLTGVTTRATGVRVVGCIHVAIRASDPVVDFDGLVLAASVSCDKTQRMRSRIPNAAVGGRQLIALDAAAVVCDSLMTEYAFQVTTCSALVCPFDAKDRDTRPRLASTNNPQSVHDRD